MIPEWAKFCPNAFKDYLEADRRLKDEINRVVPARDQRALYESCQVTLALAWAAGQKSVGEDTATRRTTTIVLEREPFDAGDEELAGN